MEALKSIFRVARPFINKYVIAIILFALFMLTGQYSIINRISLTKSVLELTKEKEQYALEIEKKKAELKQLKANNKKNLEHLAREKYLMHADNEEVFIVAEKDEKN